MNKISFLSGINDLLEVKIYGKIVDDLEIPKTKAPTEGSRLFEMYGKATLGFAMVHGSKIAGKCFKLPHPFLCILPESNIPSDCSEFPNSEDFYVWQLPVGTPIIKLTETVGNVEHIAGEVHALLFVDSDFRITDLQFKDGKITGRLRSYLRLRQPGLFGSTLFDITVIDRWDNIDLNVLDGTCITIFTIAVASAQLCFHTNPRRICGEVRVGVNLPIIGDWGQNFPIACVPF